jgi:hypothetical protein
MKPVSNEDPPRSEPEAAARVRYAAPAELAARYRLTDELAAALVGIDALTDAALGR